MISHFLFGLGHETTELYGATTYRFRNLLIIRPGVAGAVLQSPSLLIDSLIKSVIPFLQTFKTSLDQNRKS